MGRILLTIVLAVLFIALACLAIYLTYQIGASYFASNNVGMIAAAMLFIIGGFFVFRDLTKG